MSKFENDNLTSRVSERDKVIGYKVRMSRKIAGLTQEQLGSEIGVTFQQIQKYEKGINRMSATRLEKIAQILGVDVYYFYNDNDNFLKKAGLSLNAGENPAALRKRDQAERMVIAFAKIDDDNVREKFIKVVQAFCTD